MKKLLALALALPLVAACSPVRTVDPNDPRAVARMGHVMELEHRDWAETSDMMIDSMLRSGALARVENPVIAMGEITNDTMQRFDTDFLMRRIRSELVNSGQAQIAMALPTRQVTGHRYEPTRGELHVVQTGAHPHTASITVDGQRRVEYTRWTAEDETTHRMREMRDNVEWDQRTVAPTGTLVAPNLSMSGKMLQRNLRVPGTLFRASHDRVEYSLQLVLTDLRTGLSVWEEHRPLIREGRRGTAPRW